MNGIPRSAPLARVKTLSLATFMTKSGKSMREYVAELKDGNPAAMEKLFVDVGLARSVRISEDWGTTPLHSIGNATRPTMVPNNYTANVSIEKLLLDGTRTFSYITSPDYWYAKHTHRAFGGRDYLMYTYMTIDTKDKSVPLSNREVFALMPKSSSISVSANEIITAESVELVGYKHTYMDLVGLLTGNSGILNKGRTALSSGTTAAIMPLGNVRLVK